MRITSLSEPESPTESPILAPIVEKIIGSRESNGRAFAKAVTWRCVGTLDTFLWSWLVTGHAGKASAIAGIEVFTKIGLYYLHEKLWRFLPWAPQARTRSLIKAVSWRIIGGLDTFILSLLVTGNAKFAISIVSIEALTKIALYYFHERIWRRIAWGRFEDQSEA